MLIIQPLLYGLARWDDPIGYKLDVNAGADVADLNVSILTDDNGGFFAEPGELNPTYRIYRNNYHSGPLPLKRRQISPYHSRKIKRTNLMQHFLLMT